MSKRIAQLRKRYANATRVERPDYAALHKARVDKVIKAVRADNSGTRWNRVSMAKLINVSPTYLDVIFKRVTGMSPGTMARQLRIREAMRLLAVTDMSVTRIAERTGYGSIVSFSEAFLKATGQRPTAYRSSQRREL